MTYYFLITRILFFYAIRHKHHCFFIYLGLDFTLARNNDLE